MKNTKNSQIFSTPAAIIFAGVLISLAIIFTGGADEVENKPENEPAFHEPTQQDTREIEIGNSPVLGDENAPVTLVEFSDYQCGFCAKFFHEVEPTIKEKYINTGMLKLVYKDYAFLGPVSIKASEAARCAQDQGKYWQYHDLIFSSRENGYSEISDEVLNDFAGQLSLDVGLFSECLLTRKHKIAVESDIAQGQALGVSGTPTTFINGKKLVGALPLGTFEKEIENALTEALEQ